MTSIIDRIRNEPALVTAFTVAVLALVVSFGLSLDDKQIGAILAVVSAVLGFVTRAKVTPVRKG